MKPVHTFMSMVQCPVCHYTFMQQGDECCWRCSPPHGVPTLQELAVARYIREAADIDAGSAGSLLGLGFAPMGTQLPVFNAPGAPPAGESGTTPPPMAWWSIASVVFIVGWLLSFAYLAAHSAHRHGWLIR